MELLKCGDAVLAVTALDLTIDEALVGTDDLTRPASEAILVVIFTIEVGSSDLRKEHRADIPKDRL